MHEAGDPERGNPWFLEGQIGPQGHGEDRVFTECANVYSSYIFYYW